MPFTARGEALSRRVIMFSVEGSRTWTVNPSHLLMCMTTPLIFAGYVVKRTKANPARSKTTPSALQLDATKQKGGVMIRDLWHNVTDIFHNMRVVNTDANYHSVNTP